MKAYMTYGRPGCGKSTWCFNHPNFSPENYINMDDIREEMPDGKPADHWNRASDRLTTILNREPNNIFIDNTHVRRWQWNRFSYPLNKAGYEIWLVYFDVDTDKCLEQNQKRSRVVPAKVIRKWQVLPLESLNYFRHQTIIVR